VYKEKKMAEFKDEEYKFPDEIENEPEQKIEIEVEDDVPEEDRINAAPLPREIAEEVENDDLEAYSQEAKERLLQMKKLMHDERRLKDEAMREHKEAIRVANLVIEENKKLKGRLSDGEKVYVSTAKESITRELEMAKRELREAYESGDSERLAEAQEKMTDVKLKSRDIERYQPQYEENALQSEELDVKIHQPQQQPQRLDPKTQAWLDKNKWYGVDEDMSFLATGIHRRLEKEGVPLGSDHYWKVIDTEVKKRFPEKFEEEPEVKASEKSEKKPNTVVASATRTTSSKKVKLTQTQLALAKKFNLSPEQYAMELTKLESQNG
jgi:hypothetical protein